MNHNVVDYPRAVFSLFGKVINHFTKRNKNMIKEPTPHTYAIVRKDIPLFAQVVQTAHATHHAGALYPPPEGTHLIVLQVEDEIELFYAYRKIRMEGIACEPFFEPDVYDGKQMGMSAIATEPIFDDKKREFFREFDLWREDSADPFNIPSVKDITDPSRMVRRGS